MAGVVKQLLSCGADWCDTYWWCAVHNSVEWCYSTASAATATGKLHLDGFSWL